METSISKGLGKYGWLGRYLFMDFVCCSGKKKPYLHMKLKCFLHQKRNIICKRHIQLCHSNTTRLSDKVAPALKVTQPLAGA